MCFSLLNNLRTQIMLMCRSIEQEYRIENTSFRLYSFYGGNTTAMILL